MDAKKWGGPRRPFDFPTDSVYDLSITACPDPGWLEPGPGSRPLPLPSSNRRTALDKPVVGVDSRGPQGHVQEGDYGEGVGTTASGTIEINLDNRVFCISAVNMRC